jgi:hypothetical protein
VTGWLGWVLFAGLVMIASGFFNIIEGLVALFHDSFYLVRASGLVIDTSYPVWGLVLITFGVAIGTAGYGVLAGSPWTRWAGVVFAAGNAVVNLGFIAAYPLCIAVTIGLDIVVIFALIVHGRETRILA